MCGTYMEATLLSSTMCEGNVARRPSATLQSCYQVVVYSLGGHPSFPAMLWDNLQLCSGADLRDQPCELAACFLTTAPRQLSFESFVVCLAHFQHLFAQHIPLGAAIHSLHHPGWGLPSGLNTVPSRKPVSQNEGQVCICESLCHKAFKKTKQKDSLRFQFSFHHTHRGVMQTKAWVPWLCP